MGAFDTQSVCRGCGAGTHLVVVSFDVCTSGCLHVHGCVLNLPSCFPCIGPSVGFPWLLGGQWGVREVRKCSVVVAGRGQAAGRFVSILLFLVIQRDSKPQRVLTLHIFVL